VLGADLRDPELLAAYDEARTLLRGQLEAAFPEFSWRIETAERRAFMPRGALDPVDLLEIGVAEKLHRHWDYVLVVVPNELISRHGPSTLGVPSSALEAAVASTSRLGSGPELAARLTALALHLLGHLWRLDHAEEGPMRPVTDPDELEPAPFPRPSGRPRATSSKRRPAPASRTCGRAGGRSASTGAPSSRTRARSCRRSGVTAPGACPSTWAGSAPPPR
jgi:hypothetical protein